MRFLGMCDTSLSIEIQRTEIDCHSNATERRTIGLFVTVTADRLLAMVDTGPKKLREVRERERERRREGGSDLGE